MFFWWQLIRIKNQCKLINELIIIHFFLIAPTFRLELLISRYLVFERKQQI